MPIQRHSVSDILNQIRACAYDVNDPYMDGFFQWGRKQDLYRIKFVLDDIIANSSTFAPEEEWLAEQRVEQEQSRMLQILKK
jgi:hypothetical protein